MSRGTARPRLLTPAFFAIAAATLVYFIADGITLPVTPLYVRGPLGGDDFQVGLAVGAFSFSALILRPWTGRLADRRGRRPLLIAGASLFAIAMVGHLVAFSLPVLVALRLLLGAAEALLFVAALAAISDLAPEARRGEAMSFFSLSLYVGIAVGPVIGELALGDGRFAAAWLAAAGAAALAALFALRVPETRVGHAGGAPAPGPTPEGWARWLHPAGVLPGLVLLASTWGMGGFFAFVPLYAEQVGMEGSRLVYLAFAGIVIAFRSLGAWIPDRLGAQRAATIALLYDALGLLVMGLWATPAGLFAGAAIFAFGVSFAFPALSTLAVAGVPPTERGAVLGTFGAFIDLAFGVGPVTLGVVAEIAGYNGVFVAAAGVAAAGLVLLWVKRERPAPAAVREPGA